MSASISTSLRSRFFSEEELACVQGGDVPRHVAIVMDGNRRWATRQLSSYTEQELEVAEMRGHWAGAEVVTEIVEGAIDLGISVLTVYAFSTENWSRNSTEVEEVFHIFEHFLRANRAKMVEWGVRFSVIGDLSPLPKSLVQEVETTKGATREGGALDFVVALNYGGRDEIRRVIGSIVDAIEHGDFARDALTEDLISQFLDTASFGDPDLLIRTSGEKRVSNFLLWQLAYAEFYITETLWPDFTPRHLMEAVLDFRKRSRRIGR
ncbi:MAG: Isoprenyl transferase [Chlamydiae bacterium]|nr:Isoprenyl transferase [Chlamydiota bacterium]